MAQRRGYRGNQGGGGRQQNNDPRRAMTIGTAKKYARALLTQDEKQLDEMTLYSSGSIGSSKSNISSFNNTGATKINSVQTDGKSATVLFGNDKGIACIGVFSVVDQGHVLGDWEIFQKA